MDEVRVLDSGGACPDLPIVAHGGTARAVVWPGVGAEHRSMHLVQLDGGGATRELRHSSDAVYHVCEGSATAIDGDSGESHSLTVGAMIHIDAGTSYRVAAGADGALLIGGPCPPDPAMYAHLED